MIIYVHGFEQLLLVEKLERVYEELFSSLLNV